MTVTSARMRVWQAREELPPKAWAKLGGAVAHAIERRIIVFWSFSICGEFGYAELGDAQDEDQCCLRCQRMLEREEAARRTQAD